jgi:hypothetical protein
VGHWRPVIIILPASLAWRSSLAHEDNVNGRITQQNKAVLNRRKARLKEYVHLC